MNRRDVVFMLGGAAVGWPLTAGAQPQKPMPVIGFLGGFNPSSNAQIELELGAFRQGLSETGYVDGQNVAIEYRRAEGHLDRLPALAADLVARKVDVIVTQGGDPSSLAAKNATSTIPIVFHTETDPVATGLVASLARPGGNLTGVSLMQAELMPKRLELLLELVPQARAIALLVNPDGPYTQRIIGHMQEAARAKRVDLRVL
jgi:putative ABC transport system substrate-binding protein